MQYPLASGNALSHAKCKGRLITVLDERFLENLHQGKGSSPLEQDDKIHANHVDYTNSGNPYQRNSESRDREYTIVKGQAVIK